MNVRPEEVLLPIRLALQTFHLIAVLTVLWDVDTIVGTAKRILPSTTDKAMLASFNEAKSTVTSVSYVSVACFAIEYLVLFAGVTMFNRGVYIFNVITHFVGLILVVLFYYYVWNLATYYAIFAFLSALPALSELLLFLLASWLRSLRI